MTTTLAAATFHLMFVLPLVATAAPVVGALAILAIARLAR